MDDRKNNADLNSTASSDKWKRIGSGRKAGMLIPLSSVYSSRSAGIGDIADISLLIDWCSEADCGILQLLPMNEVGPIYCPYDSISSFALDPMYIRLENVSGAGPFEDRIASLKKEFPAGEKYVDYRVKPAKLALLRDIFSAQKGDLPASFGKFEKACGYWLEDFAVFNVLKFLQGGKAWWDWEPSFRDRDQVSLKKVIKDNSDAVLFQKWLQWQLFEQMSQAKKRANEKNVLLKGDLPILVSRDSADVWSLRGYFKLDFVAGAPPDMYCAKGQRWGTPTYNWDRIFADGGAYLREKLSYAENFYDILRIDHVVGLFRIWSIPFSDPEDNKGLNGYFEPRDEHSWEAHGRRILTFMLDNTSMLLCAEDLGTVPPCCVKVLKEFGIPGNDVQRWVKDWNVKHDFLPPDEFRFLAVSMLSTHDTTNWAAWWEFEAGTIDEGLFERLCRKISVDPGNVKDKLFDAARSGHGRLRWLDSADSEDKLCRIFGRNRGDLWQIIDLYVNSFGEKEKLWKLLDMKGAMREKPDQALVSAVFRYSLSSASVFCVNLITDILYVLGAVEGDSYSYRLNTPGTVNDKNWALVMPLPIEKMASPANTKVMRKMISESGR